MQHHTLFRQDAYKDWSERDVCSLLVQKPVFLAWTVICIAVIITCLLVSDPAHLDLFYIYYQPIIPIVVMFWLWGIAVRIFERNHIRYDVCFSVKDQRYLLFSRQLFQVC